MTEIQYLESRSRGLESAGRMLNVLNPSASIRLDEEGLDVVGRRADKVLVKCRTRRLLWIDHIANLR